MTEASDSHSTVTISSYVRGSQSSHHGLNSSLQLSPIKLDGTNYLTRSEASLLSIKGNKMQSFINGKSTKPAETDPTYDDWDSDISVVKTWLFNSMEPHIRNSYLFLPTTFQIWTIVAQTYAHSGNVSKKFELRKSVKKRKQLFGITLRLQHYGKS